MRRLVVLTLLVPLWWTVPHAPAMAADSTQTDSDWMTIVLAGRRIGHLNIDRRRDGDTITTTQDMVIELNRNGEIVPLRTQTVSVEGPNDEPLGFSSRQSLSSTIRSIEGKRLSDGSFEVVESAGRETQRSSMDWPSGALLAEGQRRAMQSASHRTGHRYRLLEFDPATKQAIPVMVEVLGHEQVVLPEGTQTLIHQRQQLQNLRGTQTLDLWLDDSGRARKGQLRLLGQRMEMLACSKACATAPTQGIDMMRAATVPSPRTLTANLRGAPLNYLLRVRGDVTQPFIDTDEQQVRYLGNEQWQISVRASRVGGQPAPRAEDLVADDWLQSDAPAIRDLAAKAVGNARDNASKMRRLRAFVSSYINLNGLSVGYAPALEVVKNKQGDCTESAVLLAALARAENIPAKVVVGMVYADRYAGTSRVFLPHAWVQAWVGDRWKSYDAALRHFDSTHIALTSGGGDPRHFFAATDLFGGIEVDKVISDAEYSAPAPIHAMPNVPDGGSIGVP